MTNLSPIQELVALRAKLSALDTKPEAVAVPVAALEAPVAPVEATVEAPVEAPVATIAPKLDAPVAPAEPFALGKSPEFMALEARLNEFSAKTVELEAQLSIFKNEKPALEGKISELEAKLAATSKELNTVKAIAAPKPVTSLVVNDAVATPNTMSLTAQWKAIKNPKEAAAFYTEHKSAILSEYGK